MSDVNTFVDAIGKDINAAVSPRVTGLQQGIEQKVLSDYVPQVSAFADRLLKQIVEEQSAAIGEFAATVVQEVFQRYRPELVGELRTRIVKDGLEVTGHGVRLDVKHRDSGALVSSLDVPVSLKVRVDDLSVTLTETTIALDVVR